MNKNIYKIEYEDGELIIREVDVGLFGLEIVKIQDDKESVLLLASRDQWGVWYDFHEHAAAQEDGTISYIDAFTKCLQKIRNDIEFDTQIPTVPIKN